MFTIKKYNPSETVKRTVWEILYQWRNPLSIALGTIVVVLGGWLVVYPRYTVLSEIERRIAEETERNQRLDGVVGRMREFVNNYEQFKQQHDIAVFDALLPRSIDIVPIFSNIHYFAQVAKIDPKSITVATAPAEKAGGGKQARAVQQFTLTVSFSHAPSYEDFKALLGMLESSIPLYDIDKISINADSFEETEPRVTSFAIRTYYQPDAAAPAAAPPPSQQ